MTSSIQEAGYKFHMNDIAASIGLANLKLAKQSIAVSRENVTLFKTVIPSEYQIITDVESNPSW
jgi:dTDP-4-amino-4,6-dideoxygalactose transaminase